MVVNYSDNAQSFFSQFSEIASVVIAIINLLITFYVVFFELRKHRAERKESDILRLQSEKERSRANKLRWFKDLIVYPNMDFVNSQYEDLLRIEEKLDSQDLDEDKIFELNEYVKNIVRLLRINFVDRVLKINRNIYDELMQNLDDLQDSLVKTFSNDELKLSNPKTCERKVLSVIRESRNDLLATIFNYNGEEVI